MIKLKDILEGKKSIKITMMGPKMATKGLQDVKNIIYKKLGMDWVFKHSYSPTADEVGRREKIDKQIKAQYDVNQRNITYVINESKEPYPVYHNTYSSAVQTAEEYAKKKGFTVDEDDWSREIAFGPKKPSKGKTNRASITLFKNGKQQRKALQIQVYNRGTDGNTYELNCYIN
jgi:hypothetical protein